MKSSASNNKIKRKREHKIPYRLFDMSNKNCILIGSDFWNKVGQDKNTFNELLDIFQKVGGKYSDKITKDYIRLS